MSKEAEDTIPEDIMDEATRAAYAIDWFDVPNDVFDGAVLIIARALHSERKKWDGTSTFNRLMEK